MPLTPLLMTFPYSGVARGLRAAALRRPAAQQPIKSFAPAVAQRFASTQSNQDGKVHQVIGAVVDGMSPPAFVAPPPPPPPQPATPAMRETAS